MMKNEYGRVAVIMGGNSSEREVSLISGEAVLKSLISSGVNAFAFDPAKQSLFELQQIGCDRAMIMMHGSGGEDGIIQGALEYLQIPYSGSGVMASAIAMDKYRTKLLWSGFGIPVPKDQYIKREEFNAEQFCLNISLPVIVKGVHQGSTLSLSKVYSEDKLLEAINFAFQFDDCILVEEMIVGEEFTVTVCDEKVYPLVKIDAPKGEYDYEHKYFKDDTVYTCPYQLEPGLHKRINEYAMLGYKVVGARSVARLDFLIDGNGKPYFLEINTIPGMTSHSLAPMAFGASGINFDQLCLKILDGAKLGN